MTDNIVGAFINLGGLGVILWWLTMVLVPKIQKQLDEAIHAFQAELTHERGVHERINANLMVRNQAVMESLIEHFEKHHSALH